MTDIKYKKSRVLDPIDRKLGSANVRSRLVRDLKNLTDFVDSNPDVPVDSYHLFVGFNQGMSLYTKHHANNYFLMLGALDMMLLNLRLSCVNVINEVLDEQGQGYVDSPEANNYRNAAEAQEIHEAEGTSNMEDSDSSDSSDSYMDDTVYPCFKDKVPKGSTKH